eukprot:2191001-Pyramimonas_sp.AAC.1
MSRTIFDASASASATEELFDGFILIKCNATVPILGTPQNTIGICMFVEYTFTKGILNALDAPVDGVPSTGHIGIINMLGCEKVAARVELLVVGSGFETKPSRCLSELQ